MGTCRGSSMCGVERFGVRLEADDQLLESDGTSSSASAHSSRASLSDCRYVWFPKRTALRCSRGAGARGARGIGIVYAFCGVTGVMGRLGDPGADVDAIDASSSSASANISSWLNSSYSPHDVSSSRSADTMFTPFGAMMPSPIGTSGSGCFANDGAGRGDLIGSAGRRGALTPAGSQALTRGSRDDDRGYGFRSRGGGRLRRSIVGTGGTGGSS